MENNLVADVFKIEYPGSDKECAAITDMLKDVPWIMLTRGNEFDTFQQNLSVAKDNGCKGFLAGRALWQDGVAIRDDKKRMEFFNTTLLERFKLISGLFN